MTADLPTLIVVHPRERRAKCTVRPLAGLPGFEFRRFPLKMPVPAGYVRLGLGGPVLSEADAESGLLILDGTWRWAERMESRLGDIPVRSLPPLITAYPRTSKVFDDPTGGLATVEAVYAALKLLGRSVEGVLDHYHWRDEFLRFNRELFSEREIDASRSEIEQHAARAGVDDDRVAAANLLPAAVVHVARDD